MNRFLRSATALASALTLASGIAAQDLHLDAAERARLEEMCRAGGSWLAAHQEEDGAFAPAVRAGISKVALTAVALFALARADAAPAESLSRAVTALTRAQNPDGGIYEAKLGLAVYTSGMAAAALRAVSERAPELVDRELLARVELYEYRSSYPESMEDVSLSTDAGLAATGTAAEEALRAHDDLSASHARALEFLSRLRDGTGTRPPQRLRHPQWQAAQAGSERFSYEDLLPFVYRPMQPDHQIALRAWRAIQEDYTLEKNPDLTHRYGPGGFLRSTSGLYYYYCILGKALAVRSNPTLRLANGERRDWVRDLLAKLRTLQRADGSWVNEDSAWWEDEPVLVTSYALITLANLRDVPKSRER